MSTHKKALIAEVAAKLKDYGYTVYISKDGTYGFYTDGKRVVSFGGQWQFSVDYSGTYNSKHSGSGWQIAADVGVPTREQAEEFIKAYAPQWAVRGEVVTYTTPEQHLTKYGSSSGYVEA